MTDLDDKEKADVPERAASGEPPEVHDAEVHDLDAEASEVSGAVERERLLAATVAHAMAQDAQYSMAPAGPRPLAHWWKWFLASALMGAALLVLALPPAWLAAPPRPTLTPADRIRGLQATLFLQAAEIDVFRLREGRLPASLRELDGPLPGLRYVRSSGRAYQLVAPAPGAPRSVVVWDSADPPGDRLRLGRRWVRRPFFP